MTRTLQDRDFLVWEVYPSGGPNGLSDNPNIIFHCLTLQDLRPRQIDLGSDEADAERRIALMSDAELLRLLESSDQIP